MEKIIFVQRGKAFRIGKLEDKSSFQYVMSCLKTAFQEPTDKGNVSVEIYSINDNYPPETLIKCLPNFTYAKKRNILTLDCTMTVPL